MTKKEQAKGGDLFIVDNSVSDWKVRNYLHEWADIASRFDIATGFFEIGALLALDGQLKAISCRRMTGMQKYARPQSWPPLEIQKRTGKRLGGSWGRGCGQ